MDREARFGELRSLLHQPPSAGGLGPAVRAARAGAARGGARPARAVRAGSPEGVAAAACARHPGGGSTRWRPGGGGRRGSSWSGRWSCASRPGSCSRRWRGGPGSARSPRSRWWAGRGPGRVRRLLEAAGPPGAWSAWSCAGLGLGGRRVWRGCSRGSRAARSSAWICARTTSSAAASRRWPGARGSARGSRRCAWRATRWGRWARSRCWGRRRAGGSSSWGWAG